MRVTWSVVLIMLALTPQARAAGLCPAQPVRRSFYEAGLFYFDGKGIDREVADELQRRTGCATQTSAPPRARAYALFIPCMRQRFVTVMRRDVPDGKTSLAGFGADRSLRFGAVRGVTYGGGRDEWFAGMEAEHRLELGATLPTVFRMLKSQRFAAMFAIPLQYEKELADLGIPRRRPRPSSNSLTPSTPQPAWRRAAVFSTVS